MHGTDLIKRALTQRVSGQSIILGTSLPQSKGGKATVHIWTLAHYNHPFLSRYNPLYISKDKPIIFIHDIYIYIQDFHHPRWCKISSTQMLMLWGNICIGCQLLPNGFRDFQPLSSVEFGDWNQHWAVGKKMLDNLLWVLKRIHHFDSFWKYVRYLLAFFYIWMVQWLIMW